MMKRSLIKMREVQVVDVYKVTTKIEEFDEALLVVQVQMENWSKGCVAIWKIWCKHYL